VDRHTVVCKGKWIVIEWCKGKWIGIHWCKGKWIDIQWSVRGRYTLEKTRL